jgi:hypothetical protein
MGVTNIVIVRDDAIHKAESSEAERIKYETEIGAAVIKLCLDPDFEPTANGQERIIDAAVFNHSNGVTWVDQIHSSDRQVYAWIGNCLRPIAELNKDELAVIKDIVDHQNPKPIE